MTKDRSQIISAVQDNGVFDAVVIGGGVNGIGVFRDLSLQGLRVLLVEKNDFCSGCSAAPSRMIHGGLRYLENGEFDLVKESLEERDALLTNAPHFVQPLPTVIPISTLFSGLLNSAASFLGKSGKPSSRGLVPIKLGLSLYDLVTRKRRILPKHKITGQNGTRRRWPFLTKEAKYSAVFYDAWISHPERFCLELLQDTQADAPQSLALNYTKLRREGDAYWLTDLTTGQEFSVSPKTLVNATGAWLDEVANDMRSGVDEHMVSGTKGSHLILDNKALYEALDGHMVYFENADGRVCIVFPYLGRVLAGSTDIRVEKASRVKCEPEELAYIIDSLNLVFEGIEIEAADVVFSYSGIRPLPKSDVDFTGRISRGHYTRRIDGDVPQFCMIGGKWTTFRAFGEQTSDEVLSELGQSRTTSTRSMTIGGGAAFPRDRSDLVAQLMAEFGVTAERADHLVNHYVTKAALIQQACACAKKDEPVTNNTYYTCAEIEHLVRSEHVQTLADVVLRRTSLAIRGELDEQMLDRICEITAKAKSWPAAVAEAEREALVDELVTYYGVSPERLTCTQTNRRIECA